MSAIATGVGFHCTLMNRLVHGKNMLPFGSGAYAGGYLFRTATAHVQLPRKNNEAMTSTRASFEWWLRFRRETVSFSRSSYSACCDFRASEILAVSNSSRRAEEQPLEVIGEGGEGNKLVSIYLPGVPGIVHL